MRHDTHLEAYGKVDPRPKGGADGPRRQAEILEELGEGLRKRETWSLLSHDHTAPHARQVQTPRLEKTRS